MLHADAETLAISKEIHFQDSWVGNSHVQHLSSPILKAAKPQGDITFQFRSDDCPKFLFAHFQCGSLMATASPWRYAFYPRTNPLDYSYRGTSPNQAYGYTVAKPYTVSVTKKLFNTGSYGGTNSFIFKNGIVDKLAFQLTNTSDAELKSHLFFRDFDAGTAIPNNPGDGTVGTYSTNPSFEFWAGTVTMDGASFEISSLAFESSHQAQERSQVGRQAPESYQFSDYSLRGAFGFDLPQDALKQVGSMFTAGTFSLTATLYNGTADRVCIEMPCCVREPFEYNFRRGDTPQSGQIPFRAFENNGTYPIKITVDTTSALSSLVFFGDALLGARSIPSSNWYDASAVARTLSSFTYYSHD
jgi:hypothetical protein